MFSDKSSSVSNAAINADSAQASRSKRLESIAYYIFLATIILSPIAFWPTQYVAVDLIKTFVIAIGTLVSAILYCIVSISERKLTLPTKNILWIGVLLAISLIVSSLTSIHPMKSFFGQGFELNTASFLLVLFVVVLVSVIAISRKVERALHAYVGLTIVFLIMFLLQTLRIIFGAGFISLVVLASKTSTLIGGWFDWGTFSTFIAIISLLAIAILPLQKKVKALYWVIMIVSAVSAFVVNNSSAWLSVFLVLLGLTIYLSKSKPAASQMTFNSVMKRIAWLPLVACVIALIFTWKGTSLSAPMANNMGASYSELSLPWQMTLDVTAGAIKNYPIFGIGPNRFNQAYLTYKPLVMNNSNVWNIEFGYGFGLLPTFVSAQGIVGTILWLIFFVFLGVLGARALKHLPDQPMARFILISSFSSTVMLWIIAILSIPSHAILFLAFLTFGIFLGGSISYGVLNGVKIAPKHGSRAYKAMPVILLICAIIGAAWAIIFVKKTTAMAYFGSGVKALTVSGDASIADADFSKALAFDSSDTYWRARVESALAKANQAASTVNINAATSSATQTSLKQIVDDLNQAMVFANNAVAYDPTNYYNYLSQARVSQATLNLSTSTYNNAVQQYTTAISLDRYDPSLYISLARLQVSQNKLSDAAQTIGAALQVKNDYLDAVFLLSQIYAAQGNLKDAITAAQVAVQINPQNPQTLFQLGLLEYDNKSYDFAAQALEAALRVQPDYSNAQYFLGLSYARLNRIPDAAQQFAQLAKNNPDNQEVAMILASLKAGKSPFVESQPPIVPNPEKRPTLPIRQMTKKPAANSNQ